MGVGALVVAHVERFEPDQRQDRTGQGKRPVVKRAPDAVGDFEHLTLASGLRPHMQCEQVFLAGLGRCRVIGEAEPAKGYIGKIHVGRRMVVDARTAQTSDQRRIARQRGMDRLLQFKSGLHRVSSSV